jgi:hypothetical protein
MIEFRFIQSLINEKDKIKEKVNALIEKVVEKIVKNEFNLFKSVMITIEMMLVFEVI